MSQARTGRALPQPRCSCPSNDEASPLRKLREADRMLAEGAEVPAVAKALEVSDQSRPTTAGGRPTAG